METSYEKAKGMFEALQTFIEVLLFRGEKDRILTKGFTKLLMAMELFHKLELNTKHGIDRLLPLKKTDPKRYDNIMETLTFIHGEENQKALDRIFASFEMVYDWLVDEMGNEASGLSFFKLKNSSVFNEFLQRVKESTGNHLMPESTKQRVQEIAYALFGTENERENSFKESQEQPKPVKKRPTKEDGVICDITLPPAIITDKEYSHALNPYRNKTAYIQQLDEYYFSQLEFNHENGTITTKDNSLEPILVRNLKTRESPKELDLQLLRTLYTAIFNHLDMSSIEKMESFSATIYVPTLANYMDINIKGVHAGEFLRKVTAFQNVVGIFEDKSIYPLLLFRGYNGEDNTIAVETPYIYNLFLRLHRANIIPQKNKQPKTPKTKAYHSYLMKPTIGKERNDLAVEIVAVICRLVEQRGTHTEPKEKLTAAKIAAASERGAIKGAQKAIKAEFADNPAPVTAEREPPTVTFAHKAYKGIIDEIPALRQTLENAKTASARNTVLKRAFEKAFELLYKQTDINKRYINFKIQGMLLESIAADIVITRKGKKESDYTAAAARVKPLIPTVSKLDGKVSITHEGKR